MLDAFSKIIAQILKIAEKIAAKSAEKNRFCDVMALFLVFLAAPSFHRQNNNVIKVNNLIG